MEPLDEVLRSRSPGTAYHGQVRSDPQGLWEIGWLIRETSARITQWGPRPPLELRAALLLEPCRDDPPLTVALIPVLVRVGPETWENVYETWIDPLDDAALEILAYQERVMVFLFGDAGRLEEQLVQDNPLARFSQQTLARISGRQPWTPDQFRQARRQVCQRHPDVWSLWQTLDHLDPSA